MPYNVEAKVGAGIYPKRSQVLIAIFALASVFFCCVGLYFVWARHEYSWVPFICSAIACIVAVTMWWKSHSNIDMHGAIPTTISDEKSGLNVTTDTRTLNSANAMLELSKFFSVFVYRKPLPPASGLVDDNGELVPNSKDAANAAVDDINKQREHLIGQAMAAMSREGQGDRIVQDEESVRNYFNHKDNG